MSSFTHHNHRLLAAAAAALVLTGLSAGPSAARLDAGPPAASVSVPSQDRCPLERVGQQFIRCDDLTGNGVPAPAWIPER